MYIAPGIVISMVMAPTRVSNFLFFDLIIKYRVVINTKTKPIVCVRSTRSDASV